jgi:CheY-like chemotaxis protein
MRQASLLSPKGLVPVKSELRGPSVLIVEDDPIARQALLAILRQLGFQPVSVATVAEGLEKLDGQAFAILDLELPDGLGTLVLERIRHEQRPIRVAVATGSDDPALVFRARELGAELVLAKPINVTMLLEWLRRSG